MKFIITSAILAVSPVVYAQDPPQMRITVEPGVVLPGVATQIISGGSPGGNLVAGVAPIPPTRSRQPRETLSDGSHVAHKSSSIVYRDSNGRDRRESLPMVTINDPIAGPHYMLDARIRAPLAKCGRSSAVSKNSCQAELRGGDYRHRGNHHPAFSAPEHRLRVDRNKSSGAEGRATRHNEP